MSVKENKELVRRWIEEGLNGDHSVLDEVRAPEVVVVFNEGERFEMKVKIKGTRGRNQGINNAWPDGRWTVDRMVGEGDTVAVAFTFVGTHTETWKARYKNDRPDLPATNRKGRIVMHEFYRIADGKIVETSHPSGFLRYFMAMADGSLFKEQEEES
ncbi:MAG: ester cyclase [Spirochaetia bacterium]